MQIASGLSLTTPLHERRQGKGVTSILDAEHTEKEAVDEEQDTAPSDDSDLLSLGISDAGDLDRQGNSAERQDTVWTNELASDTITSLKHGLTQRGHNLGLQAKLLLETGRNVTNSTSSVASDVRDLADVVEHVSAGEEQDRDEADGSPEVSALKDGHHVRVRNVECS